MRLSLPSMDDSISDRLRAEVPDVHVASIDDMPGDLSLSHPNGAIYVEYSGREGIQRGALTAYDVVWSIHVYARGMQGRHGVYEYLERVEDVLTMGWFPIGASGGNRMRLTDEQFVEGKGTIYHFVQQYSVTI